MNVFNIRQIYKYFLYVRATNRLASDLNKNDDQQRIECCDKNNRHAEP